MHRVEMRMRSNLLGANVEHQKIRPLSESKAIANGANAISEGFLFAVAAALIVGESYRSSRSSAKQRNRTEEAVEEVRETLNELARALGLSMDELEARRKARKEAEEARASAAAAAAATAGQGDESSEGSSGSAPTDAAETSESSPATLPSYSSQGQSAGTATADIVERERLQRAVQVLLSLALRSGWIQGQEALDLDAIMTGKDEEAAAAASKEQQESASSGRTTLVNGGTVGLAQEQGLRERIASLGRSPVVFVPPPPPAIPTSSVSVSASASSTSMPDSPPESLS
ncbi:hypothetical protein OC846_001434 [Tilletia horrida]|uniref:HTH cro/C1-type domain-containing protein n=1 Tax=Tilletia horrida TaxID=155126 RepID=A0AAN6GU22_9BASI|nr:hypothetical protein OC846_001434 [Tilletia horrida]KAK0569039.1 hypothetical protein OC861_001380 [Tilletia horrida]